MYKKCKVLMLPANNSDIGQPILINEGKTLSFKKSKNPSYAPQHIYVLSKDCGNLGDWAFERHAGSTNGVSLDKKSKPDWFLREMNMNWSENDPECWRVIAATDRLLKLPNIDFLDSYLNEFNKGASTKFVKVKYGTDKKPITKINQKEDFTFFESIITKKYLCYFTKKDMKLAFESGQGSILGPDEKKEEYYDFKSFLKETF